MKNKKVKPNSHSDGFINSNDIGKVKRELPTRIKIGNKGDLVEKLDRALTDIQTEDGRHLLNS